jgi:hypothetical protein
MPVPDGGVGAADQELRFDSGQATGIHGEGRACVIPKGAKY